MAEIVTRAQWGARHAAGFGSRPVGNLDRWLHHSVTVSAGEGATLAADVATVRTLEDIGQNRFEGGISYTFAVTEAGRVFEGTGIARIGAHTGGRNSTSAGLVLVGSYEDRAPTERQLAAVVWLLQHGRHSGWWRVATLTGGHRNVSATACPGARAFALIGTINQRAAGGIDSAPAGEDTSGAAARNTDGSLTIATDGVRGSATIARWQEVLGTHIDGKISRPSPMMRADQTFLNAAVPAPHIHALTGADTLAVDGIEGPRTIKVRQFWLFNQQAPALLGRAARAADFDGIAGRETTRLHQHALNRATARTGRY